MPKEQEKQQEKQQEYKGTARAIIYNIEGSIGYIYITLLRKELEDLFLNSETILKHNQQKYFKGLKKTDIPTLERSGGLPGGRIENPSYKAGQATEKEKIATIEKELKEEMNLTLGEEYKLLSNSRDQTRRKESNEYKKFQEQNKWKKQERYEQHKEEINKNKGENNNDEIIKIKDIPGLATIGYGEEYNFNLNKQQQREYRNENYHLAYDININLAKLQSIEEEAIYEIGGFTKLPVHTIHNKEGEITLESCDATFANVLKFPADKSAYHKIRIDNTIKKSIIEAIEKTMKEDNTNNK